MPFFEFIVQIFLWVIAIVLVVGVTVIVLGTSAAIGGAVLLFTIFTGWIPILACATDPGWDIQWADGSFMERWAFIALWEYLVVGVWVGITAFVRPDPDGLPPGLKFLAVFYHVPGVVPAQQAANSGNAIDLNKLGDALETESAAPGLQRQMKTWRYEKSAKTLAEEAAYREAKAEFARKATAMETARIKMEEAERRRKNT